MKKLVSLLVFSSLLLCACKDADTTEEYIPTISLLTPHENDAFNLDEVDKLSFTWTAEGITAFKILLSLTGDLASPQITVAGNYTKELTAEELDVQLTALGVSKGEEAKVYWSVQPAGALVKAETQVRSVRITRKSEPVPPPPPPPVIALSTPADNAQFNANTVAYPFEFVWAPDPEVSEYVLKVSPDGDFNTAGHFVDLYDGTGYTFSLDETELDDLLASANVAHDAQITLHWTVTPKDGNPDVVTQTRTFAIVRKAAPDMLALISPAADGRLCINELSASVLYEFSWTTIAAETQGYNIKFSADNFSAAITRDAGNNGSFSLTRAAAEELFSDLGVNSPAEIKWTVEPKSASVPEIEQRPLTFYKWGISVGPEVSQSVIDSRTNLIDGDVSTIVLIDAWGYYSDYYIEIDLLYTRSVNRITVPVYGTGEWGISLLDENKTEVKGEGFQHWTAVGEGVLVAGASGRYIRCSILGVWQRAGDGCGFYEATVQFND
jgi:hypothetical protein